MAPIAAAMPTPPNMNVFPGGPTHRLSLSGRYQRWGLCVAFRSKKCRVMGEPAPLQPAAIAEAAAGSIAARLDALPRAWPAWQLILLVSLGGWFEFYDLMMTAYISPGLVHEIGRAHV